MMGGGGLRIYPQERVYMRGERGYTRPTKNLWEMQFPVVFYQYRTAAGSDNVHHRVGTYISTGCTWVQTQGMQGVYGYRVAAGRRCTWCMQKEMLACYSAAEYRRQTLWHTLIIRLHECKKSHRQARREAVCSPSLALHHQRRRACWGPDIWHLVVTMTTSTKFMLTYPLNRQLKWWRLIKLMMLM